MNDNPFVGARAQWPQDRDDVAVEWDAKDVRDVARGSGSAVFEYPIGNGRREARYLIIDWGGALGRWEASSSAGPLGLRQVCR